jgi:hypothetical protein
MLYRIESTELTHIVDMLYRSLIPLIITVLVTLCGNKNLEIITMQKNLISRANIKGILCRELMTNKRTKITKMIN